MHITLASGMGLVCAGGRCLKGWRWGNLVAYNSGKQGWVGVCGRSLPLGEMRRSFDGIRMSGEEGNSRTAQITSLSGAYLVDTKPLYPRSAPNLAVMQ